MFPVVAVSGPFDDEPDNRVTALRKTIVRVGQVRFGPGSWPPDLLDRLDRITDEAILKQLFDRILKIARFEDLFVKLRRIQDA